MLTTLILGCGSKAPVTFPTALTDEDYRLYSAILRDAMQAMTEQRVVSNITESSSAQLNSLKPKVNFTHRSLLRILQNNPTTTTLEARFDADLKTVVTSDEEIEAPCKPHTVGRFWSQFRKKYPQSCLVGFSMPAWNRDRTAAMVYASIGSGGLASQGDLYVLKENKVDGRWEVQKIYPLWIS